MIKNVNKFILLLGSSALRLMALRIAFLVFLSMAQGTDSLYLNLDKAIELALKNNQSVLIAKEKINERAAAIGAARGSFLPSISLSGTYTRLGNVQGFPMAAPLYNRFTVPVYDSLGNQIGNTDSIYLLTGYVTDTLELAKRDNYVLRGSVSQPLFMWGTLINAYKIAGLALDMEKESYRKAVNDLKLQVAQSFYQTMLAEKGVELIYESYNQMKKHIAQIETLYKSGMAANLDLLRAKVQLANMKSQVIRMENGSAIAKTALKSLVGIDESRPSIPENGYNDARTKDIKEGLDEDKALVLQDEFKYQPFEIDLDSAINIAVTDRPEIINMRKTVAIANKFIAIQKAALLPKVFSSFNYDYKKPYQSTSDEWGTDWNVTVGASMPLFAGGTNLYKLKQSKVALKQAKLGLDMLENGIKLDVKSNYFSFEQEKEILSYQDENVRTAEQALQMAEQGYNSGKITNLEYMDTQLALTQAKFEQISSIANYIIARAKLINALGR